MSATSQYTNTAARVETKWIQFKQFAYGWGWLSCYRFTAHQSASLALQIHLSTGQVKKGLQGLYHQQWHRALQEEQIHAVRQGFANRREGTRARDQKSLEACWGLVFRWVFLSKCKKKVEIIKYGLGIKPADIKSWVHWGDSSGKKPSSYIGKSTVVTVATYLCALNRKLEFGSLSKKPNVRACSTLSTAWAALMDVWVGQTSLFPQNTLEFS